MKKPSQTVIFISSVYLEGSISSSLNPKYSSLHIPVFPQILQNRNFLQQFLSHIRFLSFTFFRSSSLSTNRFTIKTWEPGAQHFGLGVKVFIGDELHAVGVVYQPEAGDACCGLTGFGEAAVNDDHFSVCLDRIFSFAFF